MPYIAPNINSSVLFSNEFGTVSITPVTEFLKVGSIRKTHPQAQANMFDLETAEKIALITENHHIQLCFVLGTGKCYLVLNNSPSTAAICSVEVETFVCDTSPRDKISQMSKQYTQLI